MPFWTAIFLSGCAGKTFEMPDGTELWKTGALGVQPLAIGYKNHNGRNGFMPYGFLDAKDVSFQKVTRVFDQESNEACLEAIGAGEGVPVDISAKHCAKKESQGEYEVFLVLNRAQLAEELNKKENQKILKELNKHYKQDARIITGITYAYDHSMGKITNTDLNVSTSIRQGFTPKLALTTSSSKEVKLSDGTVFGYEMSVLCWEKDEKNSSVVHVVSSDLYAEEDDTCPHGTNINPEKI